MTSALLSLNAAPSAPALSDDLDAVEVRVLQASECSTLLQGMMRTAADLVVIHEEHSEYALFSSIIVVDAAAPRSVIVFTADPDAEKIALATRSASTPMSSTATVRTGCVQSSTWRRRVSTTTSFSARN